MREAVKRVSICVCLSQPCTCLCSKMTTHTLSDDEIRQLINQIDDEEDKYEPDFIKNDEFYEKHEINHIVG